MAVDTQTVFVVLGVKFQLVAGCGHAALYDPVVLVHVKDFLAAFWLFPGEQEFRLKGILQAVGKFVGRYDFSVLDGRFHGTAADPVKVQDKGFCGQGDNDSPKNAEKKVDF